MGVELNFLVKRRRQIKAVRVLAAVFALLLVVAGAAFYMQWSALQPAESAAVPNRDTGTADMQLIRAQDAGQAALYQQVVQALGGADLHTYAFDGANTVRMSASGTDPVGLSSNLEQLPAVTSVELVEPVQADGRITIDVTIEPEGLVGMKGRVPQ